MNLFTLKIRVYLCPLKTPNVILWWSLNLALVELEVWWQSFVLIDSGLSVFLKNFKRLTLEGAQGSRNPLHVNIFWNCSFIKKNLHVTSFKLWLHWPSAASTLCGIHKDVKIKIFQQGHLILIIVFIFSCPILLLNKSTIWCKFAKADFFSRL